MTWVICPGVLASKKRLSRRWGLTLSAIGTLPCVLLKMRIYSFQISRTIFKLLKVRVSTVTGTCFELSRISYLPPYPCSSCRFYFPSRGRSPVRFRHFASYNNYTHEPVEVAYHRRCHFILCVHNLFFVPCVFPFFGFDFHDGGFFLRCWINQRGAF